MAIRFPAAVGNGEDALLEGTMGSTRLWAMLALAIAEADADGTFNRLQAKYFKEDIRGK